MPKPVQTLTLADAKAMVLAAEACASRLGIAYSIAVVDGGGHLLHFSRGDAGVPGCASLAIDKAHTAAMFGHATDTLARLAPPGAELYGIAHALGGRAVVFGGGVPVRSNGALIGAIGASAGSVEQDIAVAQAGAAALTAQVID
uniref:GlcG/HbpS family heme-binding protein n=1 Tax=unclassified Variovorax TaxID=663243 RepID=UPI000D3B64B9